MLPEPCLPDTLGVNNLRGTRNALMQLSRVPQISTIIFESFTLHLGDHIFELQSTLHLLLEQEIPLCAQLLIMSDYGDDMDMDVDAPIVKDTVMFSSDTTSKGKRSAANLPVEAEDSLPWCVVIFSILYTELLANMG